MKIKYLLLFFAQTCISQTPEVNQLGVNGEKAFMENNFLLAKEIYTNATNLDSENKDCWFNLGASELKLGETDNACEHFYKAYLLNDGEAIKVIKENCPNFKRDSIMWLNDVEENPKFTYKGKEFLLLEKGHISPKYIGFLIKELKKSKILMDKAIDRKISIQLSVSNSDTLNVKVLNITGDRKDVEAIVGEIISTFKNAFTYISAKNKGVKVDLWEKWALPITF